MWNDIPDQASRLRAEGQPFVIATVVAYKSPQSAKPGSNLIVGASPMAQILAGLGRLLDFKVCVADPEAARDQFPEADLVLADLEAARGRIDSRSFVVVATMGTGDEEGLAAVVGTNPKYLGLVASKEKAKSLFQYMRDKGTPAEHLDRIKCPAGIELGGETLPEIALSVMAEITRLRRAVTEQTAEPVKPSKKSSGGASLPVMQKTAEAGVSSESIDPVCGMTVAIANARYKTVFEETTFYFCCLRCKETFEQSPQRYPERIGASGL